MDGIVVTGGAGTLGRAVMARLRTEGHEPGVLSRRTGANLETGAGVAEALRGARTVIHLATRPGHDVAMTRILLDAVRAEGVAHLVFVSIVGADRVPLPYYRAKVEAEGLVVASGVPWTILRATQFHDLLAMLFRVLRRSPVLPVLAGTDFQPVDVRDVAERLVALGGDAPAGRTDDLGGPEVLPMAELARQWLAATGTRRPVLRVRLPGAIARGYREGGHLAPDHADGRITFAEYLASATGAAGS